MVDLTKILKYNFALIILADHHHVLDKLFTITTVTAFNKLNKYSPKRFEITFLNQVLILQPQSVFVKNCAPF